MARLLLDTYALIQLDRHGEHVTGISPALRICAFPREPAFGPRPLRGRAHSSRS